MKKEPKIIRAVVISLVALIFFACGNTAFAGEERTADRDTRNGKDGVYYTVSRVIDGDTIVLSDGRKVRLTGVDTPEVYFSDKLLKDSKRSGEDVKTIQALGRRASAFTKELCLGKKVRLEYDADRFDRYKRTLAYVYLEDGTFVNQKIMQEGFAQVLTVPPNVKYTDLFLKAQNEAREAHRGLWKT